MIFKNLLHLSSCNIGIVIMIVMAEACRQWLRIQTR